MRHILPCTLEVFCLAAFVLGLIALAQGLTGGRI
jgi:hypothetical protein